MKTNVHKKPCTQMFMAALFTITTKWKQPKLPSTDEQINRMYYRHTMEYYSETKIKYWWMLQHGWILQTLCFMKEASHRRLHIVWFHLYKMSWRQIYRDKSRPMFAQGWMVLKLGGNGKGVIAKRYGVYLLGWSECKIDCDRYKAVNTLKVTEIYT